MTMIDEKTARRRARSPDCSGRSRRYATTIAGIALVIIVMSVVVAMSTTASAAEVNGWASHRGASYELMMSSDPEVGAYELVQLINYDIHDLRLELWQLNGTMILSQTVAPQSSMYIQLDYGIHDCRIDIVSSYYGLEGSYTRTHVYELLPPPSGGGGWVITPPAERDPDLIYSAQDMLDRLADFALEFFIRAPPVMLAGAMLGYANKRLTLLLRPTDLGTIILAAICIAEMTSGIIGQTVGIEYNRLWLVILLLGYIIGRQLTHLDTISPIRINCSKSQHTMRKEVIYTIRDRSGMYLAEQTNRAMLKRLFLDMHVPIGADGAMVPDWSILIERTDGIRKPYRNRGFWIQREKRVSEPGPSYFFGLIKTRQRSVQYELANASAWPKSMFVQQMSAFLDLDTENKFLNAELVREKMMHANEASSYAREMLVRAFRFTRSGETRRYLTTRPPVPDIRDSGEDRLDVLGDETTRPNDHEMDRPDQGEDGDANETPRKGRKTANKRGRRARRDIDVID